MLSDLPLDERLARDGALLRALPNDDDLNERLEKPPNPPRRASMSVGAAVRTVIAARNSQPNLRLRTKSVRFIVFAPQFVRHPKIRSSRLRTSRQRVLWSFAKRDRPFYLSASSGAKSQRQNRSDTLDIYRLSIHLDMPQDSATRYRDGVSMMKSLDNSR